MNIFSWGKSDQVSLKKKHLFYLGLAVTFLQPFFSGLILGFYFLSREELQKEGRIIVIASLVWGAAILFLAQRTGML